MFSINSTDEVHPLSLITAVSTSGGLNETSPARSHGAYRECACAGPNRCTRDSSEPFLAAAATSSCHAQATDKKLAGAAMNSFMKKCESDAAKACGTQATDRKLAGAAKASFTKKCVSDAVGTT